MELPLSAERMPAAQRRYQEVVILVPQYGGNKQSVLRHARFVNNLGFDAIRLDLPFERTFRSFPITADLQLGVRHVWAQQLELLFNMIPERKLIYSFSMPSATALETMARRRAHDVAGWICDGGPFLQLVLCTWNLYTHHYKVKSRILKSALTVASISFWGFNYREELRKNLELLPEGFPVLSIRGEKDNLVPPSAIDDVFALQNHLAYETLSLAEGGHLDGLKNFSSIYAPRAQKFLESHAHSL